MERLSLTKLTSDGISCAATCRFQLTDVRRPSCCSRRAWASADSDTYTLAVTSQAGSRLAGAAAIPTGSLQILFLPVTPCPHPLSQIGPHSSRTSPGCQAGSLAGCSRSTGTTTEPLLTGRSSLSGNVVRVRSGFLAGGAHGVVFGGTKHDGCKEGRVMRRAK